MRWRLVASESTHELTRLYRLLSDPSQQRAAFIEAPSLNCIARAQFGSLGNHLGRRAGIFRGLVPAGALVTVSAGQVSRGLKPSVSYSGASM